MFIAAYVFLDKNKMRICTIIHMDQGPIIGL